MNNKFKYILFLILTSSILAEEVSVFGAGDLNTQSPYGLTDSEKVILKNKNKLSKFNTKIDNAHSNIESIIQRIDGLESIFDGDSRKLNTTTNKLSNIIKQFEANKYILDELRNAQKQSIESIALLKVESSELKLEFSELKTILNKIIAQVEKEYVTKKEFNELVAFINKQTSSKKKTKIKIKKTKKSTVNFTKPKNELLLDAKKLFKRDYFTKAIPIFEYLVSKKYKPAESNFYLGEMWFHRKKYKDAIHYFKTSMTLYDQADYIPKLLLHSAIAFEKTKDIDNAINFYSTLVDAYPETQEAKVAQKHLAEIN